MTTVEEDFGTLFGYGFDDAAPAGYDLDKDCETPNPWCAPWEWTELSEWFDCSLTPYQMGRVWGERCFDDLEAILKEEAEIKAAEQEDA